MTQKDITTFISQFPVYQYAFVKPSDVEFSSDVLEGCRLDCKYYRTSWSCPPAIIKPEKCKAECLSYEELFVFSSIAEKKDITNEAQERIFQGEHERITHCTAEFFRANGCETYILTSNRCTICPKCTFPKDLCIHQDRMRPCIESHGIWMSDLLEKCVMDCFQDEKYRLLFSLVFYRKGETAVKA